METPKSVGTLEGQKILPTKFVDLEKGEEIVDVEAQTEKAVINQAMACLFTGITSIVAVILIALYIVSMFWTFKNVRVKLATACSIILAPFFICTLISLKVQREIWIEEFAMSPRNNPKGAAMCSPEI